MVSRTPANRPVLLIFLALAAVGCHRAAINAGRDQQMTNSEEARFDDLVRRWIDGMMALEPVSATQYGEHRYDDERGGQLADVRGGVHGVRSQCSECRSRPRLFRHRSTVSCAMPAVTASNCA